MSNPFISPGAQTLPFDDVIRLGIEIALQNTHTWIPAQVTRIRSSGIVDLQPLIKDTSVVDGSVVAYPQIQNVLVAYPSGNDYWIKMPIQVGDVGIALFCEESLDQFFAATMNPVSPNVLDPQDTRHHDLSDPVFIPGIRTALQQVPNPSNPDDMVLHNGQAEIYLQKPGTFKFTNGLVELVNLADQTAGQLSSLATTVAEFATLVETAATVTSTDISFLTSYPTVAAAFATLAAALPAIIAEATAVAVEATLIQTELKTIEGS